MNPLDVISEIWYSKQVNQPKVGDQYHHPIYGTLTVREVRTTQYRDFDQEEWVLETPDKRATFVIPLESVQELEPLKKGNQ